MSSSEAATAAPWSPQQRIDAVLAWLWVLVPFGYGLYQLLLKIPALFGS
jgi:hypothetical protein